jgi:rhomboid protease GluP
MGEPGYQPTQQEEEHRFLDQLEALAPRTWVTYGLIASNVLVWAWMVLHGVDALHPSAEVLWHWGGNAASEVQRGQWWRLLTATFLHGGAWHLGMNMLGLWCIGQTTERIYGHAVFLLLYLGSALLGSALSLHFAAQHTVSTGASGAVFGVAGALLVAVLEHRQKLPTLFGKRMLRGMGFFLLYSLAQGLVQARVDNAAHVGGLLAGALMAWVLPERFDMPRFVAQVKPRAMAAAALAAVLTLGLVGLAPPAAVDMQRRFAGPSPLERGMQGFQAAFRLMAQDARQVRAGTLSVLALDARSRSVYAPVFRRVQADLSAVVLPSEDPRSAVVQEALHITRLMVEISAMESDVRDGRPVPRDLPRMRLLDAEVAQSIAHLSALSTTVHLHPQEPP